MFPADEGAQLGALDIDLDQVEAFEGELLDNGIQRAGPHSDPTGSGELCQVLGLKGRAPGVWAPGVWAPEVWFPCGRSSVLVHQGVHLIQEGAAGDRHAAAPSWIRWTPWWTSTEERPQGNQTSGAHTPGAHTPGARTLRPRTWPSSPAPVGSECGPARWMP